MLGIGTIHLKLAAALVAITFAASLPLVYHQRLAAAEAHGRAVGSAAQAAEDQRSADERADSVSRVHQTTVDSLAGLLRARAAADSGRFAGVLVKYRDRITTDTVVREVAAAGERAVNSCAEGAAACAVAREFAERETARLRLVVGERDRTIAERAHDAAAPPRSCVGPAAGGAVVGLVGGALLGHFLP